MCEDQIKVFICKGCGEVFDIPNSDLEDCRRKNIPILCPECELEQTDE